MNLLKHLKDRAKLSGNQCISFDELAEWPVDQVEEAKQQGYLVQADDAEGIVCRECPENCWKDVEIRQKEGRSVGVFFCEDTECAGLLEIETERLQQWKLGQRKLSRKATSKKKKSEKRNGTPQNKWSVPGNACFIHDQGNIKFYYKNQTKPLPLRSGTQAPRVLASFIEGTQTGKEIQKISGSELPASQVIKNINRTLNTHLRKVGIKDIPEICFIYFDDNSSAYAISPNIVEQEDFERAYCLNSFCCGKRIASMVRIFCKKKSVAFTMSFS